ncbi:hypothetical protein [Enterobacter ludwigii]|uniref:Uncharacterized protein n=1 Tax=Enterobacter ludwigii TaxID=299767 RepID=A0AAX3LFF4_9ENTR|nr:hypothetical protein [Enterobacter ludwigii]EKS7107843.1 hypothetical protein [Enterobacter ludwigii]EKS7109921.1 hypothetical protein [Enterobacter ludwigii]EKS7192960.1 hypothetical protein [Enterobacter ludwigii]EKS7206511.1 hypothetical protein [Enterobacter ludwigii]ELN9421815.1 hypothetical protein [Enterobacter ludwigii]
MKKYGMRAALAMLLLTFLTTILLAGWGGYYVFFQINHFSLSMTKLEKMKSSAWHFWEYQFSDLVAPEWSGIDFLSPSDSGFSGWILPECKK